MIIEQIICLMYASCLGYMCRKRLAVLSVIPIHLRRFGLFSSIS